MNYLKMYEDFEEDYQGLPSEQEEDLFEIFHEWIDLKYPEHSKEELIEMFKPGTDSFVRFLQELESETRWFDYSQVEKIYQEISLYIDDLYTDDTECRFKVKPGVTSLAGVQGSIYLSWPDKWYYDKIYVQNANFTLDVKIILKTVLVVFIGEEKFLKVPSR